MEDENSNHQPNDVPAAEPSSMLPLPCLKAFPQENLIDEDFLRRKGYGEYKCISVD